VIDWIILVGLYVFGICVFNFLGGVGAAGEALRRWGRASAGGEKTPASPSV
jgi:hypothetical protein